MKYKDNPVVDKSRAFAIRIVNLYKCLTLERKEFVMSKQLLRSGTSVGANIKEAIRGQSKADFTAKMNISLKEISETEYWLDLLYATGFLEDKEFESLNKDCNELIRLLASIVKSSKKIPNNS